MKKILRRVGGSLGLWFNSEEREIYNMKKGYIIEIEIKSVKAPLEDEQC